MQVQLKVQPFSSKRYIKYTSDSGVKVYLHSAPENNRANKELIKYLADKLNIAKSDIKIIRGKTSKTKILQLENIADEEFYSIVG